MLYFKLMSLSQLSLCICLVSSSVLAAKGGPNDGGISSANAGPAGLVVEWFTQVEVGAGGRLVDVQYTVDENFTTTLFTVSYGNFSERISENDLDAFGKPYEIKGAEEQANLRREIIEAELKAQGKSDVKVEVKKVVVPKTMLYAVNSHGVVTAIDAESGETKWVEAVGRSGFPTIGLGASIGTFVSEKGKSVYQPGRVAVINGNSVYCLDADSGKILWSEPTMWPPSAPPGVSENFVFVPTTNGRLQAFPMKTKGVGIDNFVSIGLSTSRPLLTDRTVSWATKSGYYTVAPNNDTVRSPKYRVNASDAILSTGGYSNGFLYVTSKDGYIYSINERQGSVNWELTMGQQILESPVALMNDLYIFTRENNLFKIAAESGKLASGWDKPVSGVTQYVGASQKNFYVLDKFGNLMVLDQATGNRINLIAGSPLSLVCPNTKSDRLIVGSESGFIQCLREVGNEFPFFHATEAKKSDAQKADQDNPFQTKESSKDPFKAGIDDDPFKMTPQKKTDDDKSDPFKSGGANDPFKSGGSDDPFKSGGSDDPFKSGGN